MSSRPPIRFGREEITFTIAAVGIVAEAVASIVFQRDPSPVLVTLFGGILGVPVALSADRRRRQDHDEPEEDDDR